MQKNTSIINKMIENDVDKAFFMLGADYKKRNTYKTMHNFGTLLSKYGCEITFFTEDNFAISEKLLLCANEKKESFITLKELGDLYFKQNKYESAISFYKFSLNYQKRYDVCYNLILCYYILNDYDNMKKYSEQFINELLFSNYELASLYEIYGFACALVKDKQAAQKALNLLKKNSYYSYSPETIKLAYLCEDYLFIFEHFRKIYNEWMIESVDYMIIYQIFQKSHIKQIELFNSWVYENIVCFYNENPEIEPDLELIKAIDSNVCIPNVKFIINPVFSCDFY